MSKNKYKEITDRETVQKHKNFLNWVLEYSKKIVTITFVVYILSTLFSLYLVYLSWKQGNISGIDTLITETNNTFRDVVGGYIIKAAVENAVKIGGSYLLSFYETKLNHLENNDNIQYEENENNDEYNP